MMRFPWTPAVLEAMPEQLAELFRGLEDTIIQEICSRLDFAENLNEVTVNDMMVLRSAGAPLQEIQDAIKSASSLSDDKIDELFDEVVTRNQAYYGEMATLKGITEPKHLLDPTDIAMYRIQAKEDCRNLTRSMGFILPQAGKKQITPPVKAFQWCLDSATVQVRTGTMSYNSAITKAVKQLAGSGLIVANKNGSTIQNRVQYASGHVDHLDVAARRAVLTGVMQLNNRYSEAAMDYLQTDLVQVTAHAGARNVGGPNGWEAHSEWQGGIYRWKR